MSNYRKHIDEFFSEKFGKYRETPPADVWESLDKRLDGLTPAAPGGSYRWLLHVGIVSLILVLGVSLVKKITGNTGESPVAGSEAIAQVSMPETGAGNKATNVPDAGVSAANKDANGNSNTSNNTVQTNNNEPVIVDKNSKRQGTENNKSKTGNKAYATKNTGNKQQQPNKGTYQSTENNNQSGIDNQADKGEYIVDNGKGGPLTNTLTDGTGIVKKQTVKEQVVNKIAPVKASAAAVQFSRFEAGVKVGYETGFNNMAASKYVISPYLQYNVSRKFSILTQPSIKSATVSNRSIGTAQNYYSVDPNEKVAAAGTVDNTIVSGGTTVIVSHTTTYAYTQYHDSIAKSTTFGGTYMEFEIPLLAKYNFTKTLSAYGGVNVIYSKLMNVTEHSYTSQPIGRTTGTTDVTTPAGDPQIAPTGSVNADIAYTGTPIGNYSGPQFSAPAATIRVGYMAGISYEYSKRWMLDALIQQAPIKADIQGDYNLNSTLSSTYFRFSVGYKLTK